jgi:hypothetical protein
MKYKMWVRYSINNFLYQDDEKQVIALPIIDLFDQTLVTFKKNL